MPDPTKNPAVSCEAGIERLTIYLRCEPTAKCGEADDGSAEQGEGGGGVGDIVVVRSLLSAGEVSDHKAIKSGS